MSYISYRDRVLVWALFYHQALVSVGTWAWPTKALSSVQSKHMFAAMVAAWKLLVELHPSSVQLWYDLVIPIANAFQIEIVEPWIGLLLGICKHGVPLNGYLSQNHWSKLVCSIYLLQKCCES